MLEKGIIIVADSGNTLGLLIDYPVKYENVIFVLALNNLTLDIFYGMAVLEVLRYYQ